MKNYFIRFKYLWIHKKYAAMSAYSEDYILLSTDDIMNVHELKKQIRKEYVHPLEDIHNIAHISDILFINQI